MTDEELVQLIYLILDATTVADPKRTEMRTEFVKRAQAEIDRNGLAEFLERLVSETAYLYSD